MARALRSWAVFCPLRSHGPPGPTRSGFEHREDGAIWCTSLQTTGVDSRVSSLGVPLN